MFPSYLPVNAPDPGAYHFNFLGHNQKCLTDFFLVLYFSKHSLLADNIEAISVFYQRFC